MRNIIYAVETGGQVYGQKDYADLRKHIPTVLRNMRSQSVPDSGMAMRLVHFFLRLKLLMPQLQQV